MTRRTTNLIVGVLTLIMGTFCMRPQLAFAVSAYWDVNGPLPGAGVPSAGTWDSLIGNWTSSPAGNIGTTNWTAGNTAVFSAGNDATGAFTVTLGGTQSANGITFEEGNVTISGGTQLNLDLVGGPTVHVQPGVSANISSVIGGSTGLIKTGTGTLNLAGPNNYTGNTTVNGGLLKVNGSIAGNATVNSSASLGGSGTIELTLANNGGLVGPGNSTGTLNVGSYSQSNSGVLEMEIAGTTAGTFDKLNVSGTASLGGTLRIVNQVVGTLPQGTAIPILTGNFGSTRFADVRTVGGTGVYYAPKYVGNTLSEVQHPRGDMNRDFLVTKDGDLALFALALVDPLAYWNTEVNPDGNGFFKLNSSGNSEGNMDNSQSGLDYDDIDEFAAAIQVNGAAVMAEIDRLSNVPEPNSSFLLALGILSAVAFACRRGRPLTAKHTRSLAT